MHTGRRGGPDTVALWPMRSMGGGGSSGIQSTAAFLECAHFGASISVSYSIARFSFSAAAKRHFLCNHVPQNGWSFALGLRSAVEKVFCPASTFPASPGADQSVFVESCVNTRSTHRHTTHPHNRPAMCTHTHRHTPAMQVTDFTPWISSPGNIAIWRSWYKHVPLRWQPQLKTPLNLRICQLKWFVMCLKSSLAHKNLKRCTTYARTSTQTLVYTLAHTRAHTTHTHAQHNAKIPGRTRVRQKGFGCGARLTARRITGELKRLAETISLRVSSGAFFVLRTGARVFCRVVGGWERNVGVGWPVVRIR